MAKIAVVLFNLGGPDGLSTVRPFLFNLFNDPAIIRWPAPLRKMFANVISGLREEKAKEIYSKIEGRSPLLPATVRQAVALEDELARRAHLKGEHGDDYRVFVSMRYWHPFAAETIAEIRKYQPDEIVLLPLYPQYSTTTSQSSIDNWQAEAARAGLVGRTKTICCYFADKDFINSHAETVMQSYREVKKLGRPKILFSAHGLPEGVVKDGDPYQWQVEQTVKMAIDEMEKISMQPDKKILKSANPEIQAILGEQQEPELLPREIFDFQISYQSRVGPMKWIGPATEDVIKEFADKERDRPLIVVPISFVSEHVETLVELDIEYGNMAYEMGIKKFFRVPALSLNQHFIKALGNQVLTARNSGKARLCSFDGARICPKKFNSCAFNHIGQS